MEAGKKGRKTGRSWLKSCSYNSKSCTAFYVSPLDRHLIKDGKEEKRYAGSQMYFSIISDRQKH
jgi:SRSO17 transposase